MRKSQVFYVRPDGSDRNSGRRNTRRGAFRTVARAIRACKGLDPRPIVQVDVRALERDGWKGSRR